MANKSPGGKSVGRVTIRVIPDTSKFKDELKAKLAVIEKTTRSMRITVDKVRLDKAKIRASIAAQLAQMTGNEIDVAAKIDVTNLYISKEQLRARLEKELAEARAEMEVSVNEKSMLEMRHKINQMVDQIEGNTINLNVDAFTTYVAERLRVLARSRIVAIIPRLSQAAVAKVVTQLAALSGARKAWDWVDDIVSGIGRIDRVLPSMTVGVSGITTLVSLLIATVGGLVGIGAGLASIGPAFMVLPGLILGTGFALATLFVAMKDAKTQLDPLADSMNELGAIIKASYWAEARKPIIDLIRTLMPQLRVAFDEVAASMGGFTGALAGSFQRELGGGRLASLFKGMSDSFRILATGTDAFAGAIVSLAAIAAQYSPRLASWFVDIADKFDNWLKATAEDGRMTGWIDQSIASMKDLGRATAGITRQFAALWRAAKEGGSTGLKGFADQMVRIAEVMEGDRFQAGMTAVFRGASVAMEELGRGLSSVGGLFYNARVEIEHFIGTSGQIFGTLVSGVANALNQPIVAQGLTDFINGLRDGVDSFVSYLPEVGVGIGRLGGFVGELARQIGPVLGATLGALSDILGPFLTYVKDEILPTLGPALVEAIDKLAPKLERLFDKLGPLLKALADLAVKVLPAVTEAVGTATDYLTDVTVPVYTITIQAILDPSWIWDDEALKRIFTDPALEGKFGPWIKTLVEEGTAWDKDWDSPGGFGYEWDSFWTDFGKNWDDFTDDFTVDWDDFWETLLGPSEPVKIEAAAAASGEGLGTSIMTGLYNGITTAFPATKAFIDGLPAEFKAFQEDPIGWLSAKGTAAMNGLYTAVTTAFPATKGFLDGLPAQFKAFREDPLGWLSATGSRAMHGLYSAVTTAFPGVKDFLDTIPGQVRAFKEDPVGWLKKAGKSIMTGLIQGIADGISDTVVAVIRAVKQVVAAAEKELKSKSPSQVFRHIGQSIPSGLVQGIEDGQVKLDNTVTHMVSFPTTPIVTPAFDFGAGGQGASTAAGGFNNYGTIVTQDVPSFFAEAEKKKRRALAASSVRRVAIA